MNDCYTIGAHFKGSSKLYTYKVPIATVVEVDEHCVVNTMTGLTIVKVKEIHEEPQDSMPGVDYKYIAYLLLPVTIPEGPSKNTVTRL